MTLHSLKTELFIRCLTKYPVNKLQIEFRPAVIIENTILLLLHIGQLRVAISPDMILQTQHGIYLPFQALQELFFRCRRGAISPGIVRITLVGCFHPFDATYLICLLYTSDAADE